MASARVMASIVASQPRPTTTIVQPSSPVTNTESDLTAEPRTLTVVLPEEEPLNDPYRNASAPPSYEEVSALPPSYDEAALPTYNEAINNQIKQIYVEKVNL